MKDPVIGGDHCRHIPKEDFPRRKAQIAIDKLEEVIGKFSLTMMERLFFENQIIEIRYNSDIPKQRLYSKVLDEKRLTFQIKIFQEKELEIRKKNEEMKKLDEYNPSPEKHDKIKNYIEETRNFIREKVHMTQEVENEYYKVLNIVYANLKL